MASFFRLSLTLLVFFFSINVITAELPFLLPNFTDIACGLANCGQGICKPSNGTLVGVDCECNPGWKKIQIGDLTFPSCVVPNCTLDFNCGSETTTPPPPPAPLLPPPLNLSNPCAMTWCGDGTCVANGIGHICKCNEGSANLMDLPGLACFKECYFGADCKGLGFGRQPTPPPPPPPPPPSTSDSTEKGSGKVWNYSSRHALTIVLVATTFLSWH